MPIDDPRVLNLFAACQACKLSVTIHIAPEQGDYYGLVDAPGLPGLENTLRRFPNCKIMGHSQPFWAEMSTDYGPGGRNGYPKGAVHPGGRLPQLFERYPNLYGDLSAGSGFNAISRDPEFGYAFLEEFQDRLYFATDVCLPTQADTVLVNLKRFLEAGHAAGRISDGVFAKITHRNAQRLLGLH